MSIILLLHLFMLAFTFGHVELLTVDYHSIDTPIVELNNHTLREVFEKGNIAIVSEINAPLDLVSETITPLTLPYTTNTTFYVTRYQSVQMISNTRNTFQIEYDDLSRVEQSNLTNYQMNIGIHSWVITSTKDVRSFKLWPHTINPSPYLYTNIKVIEMTSLGISSLTVVQMDYWFNVYQENISADDVTYVQNEMTITDLTYILGFSFIWVVIIWSIRKVVL